MKSWILGKYLPLFSIFLGRRLPISSREQNIVAIYSIRRNIPHILGKKKKKKKGRKTIFGSDIVILFFQQKLSIQLLQIIFNSPFTTPVLESCMISDNNNHFWQFTYESNKVSSLLTVRWGHVGRVKATHHRRYIRSETYPIFVIKLTLTPKSKITWNHDDDDDDGGWPRWLNLRLKGSAGCTRLQGKHRPLYRLVLWKLNAFTATTRQLELSSVRDRERV